MAVYRFSKDGADRIVRRASFNFFMLMGAAVLAGFGISAINSGRRRLSFELPLLLVVVIFLLWMQRLSVRKTRSLVESTEFEIDGEELTARNSQVSITIRREEVVELRYLRDGILVRGTDVNQTVQLKPELEQFDELVLQLEDWVPPEAPRIQSSSSMNTWIVGLVLANLGLFVAAFSTEIPSIAVPCCIAEAILLVLCIVWVWRSKWANPKLKRLMLASLFPAVSLLGRAYLLVVQT